jgi:uncharacterized protein YjbI with pentapeptide repeats
MANEEHLELIRQGVDVWNAWRAKENFDLRGASLAEANLREADLRRADLREADLRGASLVEADLRRADLRGADLRGADLRGADLFKANLIEADLCGANLIEAYLCRAFPYEANLVEADLREADLRMANLTSADLSGAALDEALLDMAILWKANLTKADLRGASLVEANLAEANFSKANLDGATLHKAILWKANLSKANLSKTDLTGAALVETNLENAVLTGCRIYGISAWNVKFSEDTKQQDLVITELGQPEVTVDNIEVAQFVYLLLHNEKIRDVIDTVGKKGVLLLGRFTEGRIAVLELLREELRKRGYLPIVFNFNKPETKDFTETVRLLAGLSHFVIADITNPKSAPLELQATVPEIMVPFQPIIEKGQEPFAMLTDLWIKHRDWVFEPIHYSTLDALVGALDKEIIQPAEVRFAQLLARKAQRMKERHVY